MLRHTLEIGSDKTQGSLAVVVELCQNVLLGAVDGFEMWRRE